MRRLAFACACAVLSLSHAQARAALVTLQLGGAIEQSFSEGFGAFAFTLGEGFLLTLTYDTDLPDLDPAPGMGFYRAGFVLDPPLAELTTANGFRATFGAFRAGTRTGPGPGAPFGFSFDGPLTRNVAVIFPDAVLTSEALPTLAQFAGFGPGQLLYTRDSSPPAEQFNGTAAVVPEPTTLGLAGIGLAAAGLRRARGARLRRRNSPV